MFHQLWSTAMGNSNTATKRVPVDLLTALVEGLVVKIIFLMFCEGHLGRLFQKDAHQASLLVGRGKDAQINNLHLQYILRGPFHSNSISHLCNSLILMQCWNWIEIGIHCLAGSVVFPLEHTLPAAENARKPYVSPLISYYRSCVLHWERPYMLVNHSCLVSSFLRAELQHISKRPLGRAISALPRKLPWKINQIVVTGWRFLWFFTFQRNGMKWISYQDPRRT